VVRRSHRARDEGRADAELLEVEAGDAAALTGVDPAGICWAGWSGWMLLFVRPEAMVRPVEPLTPSHVNVTWYTAPGLASQSTIAVAEDCPGEILTVSKTPEETVAEPLQPPWSGRAAGSPGRPPRSSRAGR
jgi:hypothetical protein